MTEIKEEISLVDMAKDLACIKQAIMGNGQPGLCQRVNDLEASQKANYKITGICSGIGVVVGSVITHLFQMFRS